MYGMEDGTLTNDFPLGVSNEFIIDEEAEITVKEGTLLVSVYWG
jgi:thiamine pyrophosphokinase